MEKRDIALAQLRRAIQLFRKSDFVCAATLAGAAEEILGRLAKKRAGHNAIDAEVNVVQGLADVYKVPRPDRPAISSLVNRIRNEFKHNDSGDNEWVPGDFENGAASLIERAINNWCFAYGVPKDRILLGYMRDSD